MYPSESPPAFDDVVTALRDVRAVTSAPEIHGMLCGFICVEHHVDVESWLIPILGDENTHLSVEDQAVLRRLYDYSYHRLSGIDIDFKLLLPEDEESLSCRAEALSKWCQGFLSGLGLAGAKIDATRASDMTEILQRFSDIAQLNYNDIDVRDEDEMAFIQVAEYARMAVLTVYSELSSQYGSTSGMGSIGRPISKYLH